MPTENDQTSAAQTARYPFSSTIYELLCGNVSIDTINAVLDSQTIHADNLTRIGRMWAIEVNSASFASRYCEGSELRTWVEHVKGILRDYAQYCLVMFHSVGINNLTPERASETATVLEAQADEMAAIPVATIESRWKAQLRSQLEANQLNAILAANPLPPISATLSWLGADVAENVGLASMPESTSSSADEIRAVQTAYVNSLNIPPTTMERLREGMREALSQQIPNTPNETDTGWLPGEDPRTSIRVMGDAAQFLDNGEAVEGHQAPRVGLTIVPFPTNTLLYEIQIGGRSVVRIDNTGRVTVPDPATGLLPVVNITGDLDGYRYTTETAVSLDTNTAAITTYDPLVAGNLITRLSDGRDYEVRDVNPNGDVLRHQQVIGRRLSSQAIDPERSPEGNTEREYRLTQERQRANVVPFYEPMQQQNYAPTTSGGIAGYSSGFGYSGLGGGLSGGLGQGQAMATIQTTYPQQYMTMTTTSSTVYGGRYPTRYPTRDPARFVPMPAPIRTDEPIIIPDERKIDLS